MVGKRLLSREIAQRLIIAAKSLFSDDSVIWPLHCSAFYLGRIPDVTELLGFEQPALFSSSSPSIQLSRDIHSIALEWHTHLIRLAGRIWDKFSALLPLELASDFSIPRYCASQCISHRSGGKLSSMRF
jgi:hypothetical protein